ncbi:hypothetical protein [Rhodovulum sp. PH10]|uniref:hypothetical protein n=1 Tax=Rhodovulum sp. PH10 TaxID=1187851 RepID=UPI000590BAC4|nr:hypothetical protein [Rhodovulum sp. PH10]
MVSRITLAVGCLRLRAETREATTGSPPLAATPVRVRIVGAASPAPQPANDVPPPGASSSRLRSRLATLLAGLSVGAFVPGRSASERWRGRDPS